MSVPNGPTGAPAAPAATPRRRGHPATAAERAARRVAIAERRAKVSALVLNKIPQMDVARKLGVSRATVSADVRWLRSEWLREGRDNISAVVLKELATLDADEARLRTKMMAAQSEDLALRYYAVILRLMERRARLLGLDAPERIEHSGTVTEERIDVRAILLDPAAAALAADLVLRANQQADPARLRSAEVVDVEPIGSAGEPPEPRAGTGEEGP